MDTMVEHLWERRHPYHLVEEWPARCPDGRAHRTAVGRVTIARYLPGFPTALQPPPDRPDLTTQVCTLCHAVMHIPGEGRARPGESIAIATLRPDTIWHSGERVA